MKKKLIFVFASVLLAAACSKYDDSALTGRVDRLESRVSSLEALCQQMNTNISSLQSLVSAVQNGDYITSVSPVTQGDRTIGYTIAFAKGPSITIYHGQDGEDGKNGANGKDGQPGAPGASGQNGKDGQAGTPGRDGSTPEIGVKEDDGVLYWTLDGDWLLDEHQQKIRVTGEKGETGADGSNGADGTPGKDGVTPKFKIEDGYWWVSYNNGADDSWQKLGQATGDKGADGAAGSSIFEKVEQDEDKICFTLIGGEQIIIPKNKPFSVAFDYDSEICAQPNAAYTIHYTITGADEYTDIRLYAQNGLRATLTKTDFGTGSILVTMPQGFNPQELMELLVFVSDGRDRTIMRAFNFVEGVLKVTNSTHIAGSGAQSIEVPVSTNLVEYRVDIPVEACQWLSQTATRAELREETIVFSVKANDTGGQRQTTVCLSDMNGVVFERFLILQRSDNTMSIEVTTAGQLGSLVGSGNKDVIEDLTVTGTLNANDFTFINGMKKLKFLDLTGLSNTTLPGTFTKNATIETILLPSQLTAIPESAFENSKITSLILPDSVVEIGKKAFLNCTELRGDLVIPDSVTTISSSAFEGCGFDGTLTLGQGLESIGERAFYECANFKGNLVIPDSVKKISGAYSFYNCKGFDGVLVIGSGMSDLGSYTFVQGTESGTGYSNLRKLNFKKIYCKATTPPNTSTKTFGDNSIAAWFPAYLGVPIGCKDAYAPKSPWFYFSTIEEVDFDELGF